MLYDHSIGVAYLGFHTLLYFEHRVFLALDVFCYYNKGTQKTKTSWSTGEILSYK